MASKPIENLHRMARHIEMWLVDWLIPWARNPRTHSDAQVAKIAASIAEFGFNNPILVDTKAGIIAGHGRLLAARKLGLTEVPVIVLDHLTEAHKRAYVIADNKLAENAGWDAEMLRIEIEALQDESFDVSLLGFEDEELARLLAAHADCGDRPLRSGRILDERNSELSRTNFARLFRPGRAVHARDLYSELFWNGAAAALNQDGSINTPTNPANASGIVVLFATGEGQTTPAGTDGKLAKAPFPQPNLSVSVTIGSLPAQAVYAGAAPGGVAGLMQINAIIPASVHAGSSVPLVIRIGSAISAPGVSISVRSTN
jgi:hypothetical protein